MEILASSDPTSDERLKLQRHGSQRSVLLVVIPRKYTGWDQEAVKLTNKGHPVVVSTASFIYHN